MPERQFRAVAARAYPHRTALWLYRGSQQVWLWICFAVAIGFIQFAFKSQWIPSPIDLRLAGHPYLLWAFHVEFLLAGIFLFAGIWFYLPRLEVAGHVLLSIAILLSAIATGLQIGFGYGFFLTGSLSIASAIRVWFLLRFTPPHDLR